MGIFEKLKDKVMNTDDFYLMHEDHQLAMFKVRNSEIVGAEVYTERELLRHLPFMVLYSNNREHALKTWIMDRIGVCEEPMEGYTDFEMMLLNLGVSLSDHYWFKPVTVTSLRWLMVSVYTRDFLVSASDYASDVRKYSPNTTLKGNMLKHWDLVGDKRVLVKSDLSNEHLIPYLEIFASRLHHMQHKFKCVKYGLYGESLVGGSEGKENKGLSVAEGGESVSEPLKETESESAATGLNYYSMNFTSVDRELLTMDSLFYVKNYKNYDLYDRVLELSKSMFNLDLHNFLDYMMLTDFLLTNVDRDFTNFAFLRDSHDLRIIGMAPLYDFTDCLGVGLEDSFDINKITTNSFFKYELEGIRRVKNYNIVDIDCLPTGNYLYNLLKNADITEGRRLAITQLYQDKIAMLKDLQRKGR